MQILGVLSASGFSAIFPDQGLLKVRDIQLETAPVIAARVFLYPS